MKWAALIAWLLTAVGGFVLLAVWLARGGMSQGREPSGNRIRPPLILSHFLLAAVGLVLWIVYLANDSDTLAWIALVLLGIVAVLGWAMFAIWYQRRQGRGRVGEALDPGTPAEQHFPVPIVTLHGIGAVTTVVLVLLTALGVGD